MKLPTSSTGRVLSEPRVCKCACVHVCVCVHVECGVWDECHIWWPFTERRSRSCLAAFWQIALQWKWEISVQVFKSPESQARQPSVAAARKSINDLMTEEVLQGDIDNGQSKISSSKRRKVCKVKKRTLGQRLLFMLPENRPSHFKTAYETWSLGLCAVLSKWLAPPTCQPKQLEQP